MPAPVPAIRGALVVKALEKIGYTVPGSTVAIIGSFIRNDVR